MQRRVHFSSQHVASVEAKQRRGISPPPLADIVRCVVEDQKERKELLDEGQANVMAAAAGTGATTGSATDPVLPPAMANRRRSLGGLGLPAPSEAALMESMSATLSSDTATAQTTLKPIQKPYHAVRIDNNELRSLEGFIDAIRDVVLDLDEIKWLDLSFNNVPRVAGYLDELRGLQMLTLHGNALSEWRDVRYLSHFPELHSLTLHGTPLYEKPHYRAIVLGYLPQLRKLDSVRVTGRERDVAEHWCSMHLKRPAHGAHDEERERASPSPSS